MSKSLQDQLLALGLASEPASKKPRPKHRGPKDQGTNTGKPAPKSGRKARGPAASADNAEISLEQAYRIRQQEEQANQARARARKIAEDKRRAEINRAIRKIVDAERLNVADASEARYFMHKERIRKVYVTPDQLERVNSGQLGVVYLSGGYHLLTMERLDEVKKFAAEHVPDLLAGSDTDGSGPHESDAENKDLPGGE